MQLRSWIFNTLMLGFLALFTSTALAKTPVQDIQRIHSTGNISIELANAALHEKDSYTPVKNNQNLRVRLKNNTLYLNQDNTDMNNTPAHILIKTNHLREIDAYDSTTITSKGVAIKDLIMKTDNSSAINLDGKVSITHLDAAGPGTITINWVDSKNLDLMIRSSTKVKLAGIVEYMRARVVAHSQLDAQYLRVGTAVVQTRDYANAKITAIDDLKAFAFDNSNIYYYKQPKHIHRYTSQSGNILQLDWRK